MVELDCPDIVKVPQQSEQAPPELVVPDLFWQGGGQQLSHSLTAFRRWARRLNEYQCPTNSGFLRPDNGVAETTCIRHLDLIVVAARDEQRLGLVEVDSSHRAIMLIEPVYQRAHAVVP